MFVQLSKSQFSSVVWKEITSFRRSLVFRDAYIFSRGFYAVQCAGCCCVRILLAACQLKKNSATAVRWPRGWHVCLPAAIRSTQAATKSFHFTFSLSSIIRLRATSVGWRALNHGGTCGQARRGWRLNDGDVERHGGGDRGTLVDIRPAPFVVCWLAAAMSAGPKRSPANAKNQRGSKLGLHYDMYKLWR